MPAIGKGRYLFGIVTVTRRTQIEFRSSPENNSTSNLETGCSSRLRPSKNLHTTPWSQSATQENRIELTPFTNAVYARPSVQYPFSVQHTCNHTFPALIPYGCAQQVLHATLMPHIYASTCRNYFDEETKVTRPKQRRQRRRSDDSMFTLW